MTASSKAERLRGLKSAWEHIPLLQQKWPAAFPFSPKSVRPLASSVARTLVQEMGWSAPYANGVLSAWKNRTAYCNAVLRFDERLNIDGSLSAERVDDDARETAKGRLAWIAQRPPRVMPVQKPESAPEDCGGARQTIDGSPLPAIEPAHREETKNGLEARGVGLAQQAPRTKSAEKQARAKDVLEDLERRFPASLGAGIPIAASVCGVLMATARADELPFSADEIYAALGLYCGRPEYLQAIVQHGQRYGIDGSVVEPIDAESLRRAQDKLEASKAARVA